jgi:acetylornithine deacetylase/succinyl-diaminopimelate desuccinylase-like protein
MEQCRKTLIDDSQWQRINNEALSIFQHYVQIDTSNPPGRELPAALFLKDVLDKEGIHAQIHSAAPERANVVAHLKGSGKRRPLILLNHMDVVPVEPDETWEAEPFSGSIMDGFLWGRGTLDMKGMGILELMTMIAVARSRRPLSRDLIFLATADEETGGQLGIEYIFDKVPLLATAEYALNEGGGIRFMGKDESIPCYCIGVAEKVACRLKLTAVGKGGHGSIYNRENPNLKLMRALMKLDELYEPPYIIDTVQSFFKNIAPLQDERLRDSCADLRAAIKDREFDAEFSRNPHYEALIRTTKVPTMLRSGSKINVVPPAASAFIDCRLVPGQSREAFLAALHRCLSGDGITIEVVDAGRDAPESPSGTSLYMAIESFARGCDRNAVVTPFMMAGGSDSSYLRRQGIPSYGFVPFRLTQAERQRVHGTNERISLANLSFGLKALVEIILELENQD